MGLLEAWLGGEGILLGDGAMGTMLLSAGLEAGEAPERLNLERPEAVRAVHDAYIGAGADVVTTNTFGANRFRLAVHGLEAGARRLNRTGAEAARRSAEAASREVLVAGSVGPTGALLAPVGDLPFEEARAAFEEQCRGLAEGGADFLLIETMSDLEEARAALEGARAACALPLFCTMTFDTHGRTMMGTSPGEAAAALPGLGARAIGSNCGNGPDEMETVMAAMAGAGPGVPLIVQSNAGLPRMAEGGAVYDAGPGRMAAHAVRCLEMGIRYVGGCCGTTPRHIEAMGRALRGALHSGVPRGGLSGGGE